MTSLLDVELDSTELAAALAGQPSARERIYQRVAGPVFALISRLVPLRATREDVFQDTLMAVFEHLPRFRGEAPFGAWVRRIAVNHCFMHLRSPWQRARILLSDSNFVDAAGSVPADSGVRQDLERLLACLPATARAVVWLHEVEGWSHEEIATASGRTISFSKSQLARAHARLRERVTAQPAEPVCHIVPRTP